MRRLFFFYKITMSIEGFRVIHMEKSDQTITIETRRIYRTFFYRPFQRKRTKLFSYFFFFIRVTNQNYFLLLQRNVYGCDRTFLQQVLTYLYIKVVIIFKLSLIFLHRPQQKFEFRAEFGGRSSALYYYLGHKNPIENRKPTPFHIIHKTWKLPYHSYF